MDYSMQIIDLDVSDLPAPEPFHLILQQLKQLDTASCLRVFHRKQPLLLYQPLEEMGYRFHVQKNQATTTGQQTFEIFIWQKNHAAPDCLKQPNLAQSASPKHHCDCDEDPD